MVPEPVNDFFATARRQQLPTVAAFASCARRVIRYETHAHTHPLALTHMDLGILVALAMLIIWAVWAFAFSAPGVAHILLTAGVFLLIYRIVVRGTPGYGDGER